MTEWMAGRAYVGRAVGREIDKVEVDKAVDKVDGWQDGRATAKRMALQ
jgi:hypothetical protein